MRVRSHVLERHYKPGEIAQESGVYRVLHQRHRAAHEALLLAGMRFPACQECGAAVRFRIVQPARHWEWSAQDSSPAVLVADPEPAFGERLKYELEREGYRVEVACNYGDALAELDRHPFDAVIAELDLDAERDGLELARSAHQRKSGPLVILATANPSVTSLRAVLGSRIQYLVVKPIDLGELRAALARLILRRAATQDGLQHFALRR